MGGTRQRLRGQIIPYTERVRQANSPTTREISINAGAEKLLMKSSLAEYPTSAGYEVPYPLAYALSNRPKIEGEEEEEKKKQFFQLQTNMSPVFLPYM